MQLAGATRDFPLKPEHLADDALAYEGPPLFCLSDSVEACRLFHERFAARRAPATVHFFDVAALHIKHTARAQKEFGEDDALASQRLTYFQFHLMSRASHTVSTGSEFHTAARLLGTDPPCAACAQALALALDS